MNPSVEPVSPADLVPYRELYRSEMSCQIIHDSLHARKGWTESYLLKSGDHVAGYGSVAVGGPWTGKPAIFEFYILRHHRHRTFDLFAALLPASRAIMIETQSNDPFLTPMLHVFARDVASEAILFHDGLTTHHPPPDVLFRAARPEDGQGIRAAQLDSSADWLLTVGDTVVATGGILFHYNRPYGDIFMSVAEPYRRRGLGAYLVQELKRVCHEGGHVPAARCNLRNVASRRTLQKAGFVPCGHILSGPAVSASG